MCNTGHVGPYEEAHQFQRGKPLNHKPSPMILPMGFNYPQLEVRCWHCLVRSPDQFRFLLKQPLSFINLGYMSEMNILVNM